MDSNSAAMVPALLATNRRILILYGSETGNSQDFANDLEKIAERLRFVADVLAMDDVGLVRK